MDTCRFQNLAHNRYIVPGETRTATGTTVVIMAGPVQFCPYVKVDEEVDRICDQAKVSGSGFSRVHWYLFLLNINQNCIEAWPQNPFAAASWLHYQLANCHPFDVGTPVRGPCYRRLIWCSQDGNGRTCRLIASIPLVMAGYPPININLTLQHGYYAALREVFYRRFNENICSLCTR